MICKECGQKISWAEIITSLLVVVPWVFGVALAVNPISLLVSILFPPYAWVLCAKWILSIIN